MKKLKLLYVDDEPASLDNFRISFGKEFNVLTAASGEEGLAVMAANKDVALVVTDQRMDHMSGVDFLEQLQKDYPDTVRLILTAFTDTAEILDAINRGHAFRYVVKPWETKDLRVVLKQAVDAYQTILKNRELTQAFEAKTLSLDKLKAELEERAAALKGSMEDLDAKEVKFRSVVEAASDAIVTVDGEGLIMFWNQGATEIFGYPAAEALGRPFVDLLPKEDRKAVTKMLKKTSSRSRGGVDRLMDLRGVRKDESEFPMEMSESRWRTKDGSFVTLIIRDISSRKAAEEVLRQREAELETHTHNLQEVNAALNVLLVRREEDKRELEERVLTNVKRLIMPYMEKLRNNTELSSTQTAYVTILETNLKEIISPVTAKMAAKYLDLTPKEIQIANLIKEGRTNKDIAKVVRVSINTVLFHRHNLRKKLGLLNKKANLRSYLTSLPT
ncbi:MAG: PAS domain S-box protein [Thermodesulfobacteriota bacterium]